MFVSGSLKDKSIDFYREKTLDFDENGINTSEVYFSYKGEIVFAPWEKDKERKLISHEEKHIRLIDEKIHGLIGSDKCSTNYIYFNGEINKILSIIKSYDRQISYALIETLYKDFSISKDRILTLMQFNRLLTYLEDKYDKFDQNTIDTIMNLYLKGFNYDEKSVNAFNLKRFGIDESKIDLDEIFKLYKLGKFISPNRLSKVGKSIGNEHSKYVLPIYFLLKDNQKAEKFLSLCKTPYLDRYVTIENAEKLGVNENILSLIK